MRRVAERLRPGGVFVNAEHVAERTPWLERSGRARWRAAAAAAGASEEELDASDGRMELNRCATTAQCLQLAGGGRAGGLRMLLQAVLLRGSGRLARRAERAPVSAKATVRLSSCPSFEAIPTEDDVMDALSNVIDPELGLDFVELGLIYGVEVDQGNVR